jgi:NAD+ diphosphatase
VARSRPPFAILDALQSADASTYAAARSLIDWHARHPFCPRCGHSTSVFRAGWGRRCDTCATEHYPRTDAVVIMLAQHGDRVLVGRQPRFPPRRYSALAGFLEVGESLEEAVARELREEAGLITQRVHYLGSQPWPFPSQLMLACVAEVESDALQLDGAELDDAMWVTKDDVRAALRDDPGARFLAPPHYAIAHSLLRHWCEAVR